MGRPRKSVAHHAATGRYYRHPSERPRLAPEGQEPPRFTRAQLIEAALLDVAIERFGTPWHEHVPEAEIVGEYERRRHWVTAQFMRQWPGQRSSWWWQLDAPERQRRRVGGVGVARHEWWPTTAATQLFFVGFPMVWLLPRDAHLQRNEPKLVFDPANPPTYEAEPQFLRRHGLFRRGEERRVPPQLWLPEALPKAFWPV